jgi:hypothetical protein
MNGQQRGELAHGITAIKDAMAMLDMISKGNEYMPEDTKGMAQRLGGALYVVKMLKEQHDNQETSAQFWYEEYSKARGFKHTSPTYEQPSMLADDAGAPLFSMTQ